MSDQIILPEADKSKFPGVINLSMDLTEDIESQEQFFELLNHVNFLAEKVKECKAKFQAIGIRFMEENNLKEINYRGALKVILTHPKKNKYITGDIYKALNFTHDQIAVLPKNPSFRKTEILKREETAGAWYEEIEDKLEVKLIDEQYLPKK